MLTDLEIAQSLVLTDIETIAKRAGINKKYLEKYGNYKAKINLDIFSNKTIKNKKDGKLILVTAINPTSAGEGKTTTSVGLADSLNYLGHKTGLALREPSMGPVFGIKGGATGGGFAQVLPMEDINLHFTGDLHAITSANNLISAVIDNHIYRKSELNLNPEKIVWRRCIDMNDRALRNIEIKFDNGIKRADKFNITVASEIMAVLALAKDIEDLRNRLESIIIGYNFDDEIITVKDLNIVGSLITILKDAIKPNLVQTIYKTPTFIHCGPFANIAHGCNSYIATKLSMKLNDYTVTEAGFGADLGAEKFIDIKCNQTDIYPDCVVLVATIRALKLHGGLNKNKLNNKDLATLKKGFKNLLHHYKTITEIYKLPVLVALNEFSSDSVTEIKTFMSLCEKYNIKSFISSSWKNGSLGCVDLAKSVVETIKNNKKIERIFAYNNDTDILTKIENLCKKIYNVDKVYFNINENIDIDELNHYSTQGFQICMAKTPYAINDGSEDKHSIVITNIRICTGAKFIVVETGNIMTMPGLPLNPLAEKIDLIDNKIVGMI
jgi:formate--tetrahydrofolate ligase